MTWWQIVREVLVIVAVLYLFDCLTWVRPGQNLLSSPWGKGRLRAARPGPRWIQLAPHGVAWRLARPPLRPVREGVWIPTDSTPETADRFRRDAHRFVTWGDLRAEREHAALVVDGHRLPAPSPVFAEAWRRALVELREAPSDDRIQALEERAFDPRVLEERLLEAESVRGPLDVLGTVFLGWWLVLLPLAFFGVLPSVAALPLLAIGLVLWPLSLLFTVARLRELDEVDQTGQLLPFLLSPPNLMRSGAALTVDFLHPIDPLLARARLLDDREALRAALQVEWHGARCARLEGQASAGEHAGRTDAGETPDGDGGWSELWARRECNVIALAEREGLRLDDLTSPVHGDGSEGDGWCPFCRGTYAGAQVCASCTTPLLRTTTSRS